MSSCSQLIKKELPVFNPSDFDPKLVDTSLRKVNQNHTVKDFNLTNQNGVKISSKDYENKVYVVDFFFTRCPSICPIMTDNMLLIQDEFINDDQIMLLSLSVTPEIDSVSVLKNYAIEKGINDLKWNITTGSKKHIYDLVNFCLSLPSKWKLRRGQSRYILRCYLNEQLPSVSRRPKKANL